MSIVVGASLTVGCNHGHGPLAQRIEQYDERARKGGGQHRTGGGSSPARPLELPHMRYCLRTLLIVLTALAIGFGGGTATEKGRVARERAENFAASEDCRADCKYKRYAAQGPYTCR